MRPKEAAKPNGNPPPFHVPTSVHLATLLDKAEGSRVSVGWLVEQLGERCFGITLFMMAVLAFVPGVSTVAGVLIAWPAIQMILGHEAPVLPGFFARRQVAVDKLARAIRFIAPRLRWVEKLIKPRWYAGMQRTKRPTGIIMLLLGLTLISPFPFSHLIPALVIMLLALAYLEEDGFVLLIALTAALTSLAITGAALWGGIETIDWLDPV